MHLYTILYIHYIYIYIHYTDTIIIIFIICVLFNQECGYNFARPYFAAMVQTEKIRAALSSTDKTIHGLSAHKLRPDTTSLTDLANIMSETGLTEETLSVFDITNALGEWAVDWVRE